MASVGTCPLFDDMPNKGWFIEDVRYKIVEGIAKFGEIACCNDGMCAEECKRHRIVCCQDISMASLEMFNLKDIELRQINAGLGCIEGLLHRKIRNEVFFCVFVSEYDTNLVIL